MTTPHAFLTNEFKKRKARNPNFSLRSFAKWIGVSPAQISQMLTGKRPITMKSLVKISDRLDLSPSEKNQLFASMVRENSEDKENPKKSTIQMQEDQFRLISDWYHLAILSLTQIKGAQPDPRWIARRLGISVDEASQALLRLERMGVIQLRPIFKQITEPFEVVSQTTSEAIRKYHKQNLNLAIEKIETVPVELRQFQSISIPLNPKKLSVFKNLIDEFLETATVESAHHSGTEVYNINVQLFPVTKLKE